LPPTTGRVLLEGNVISGGSPRRAVRAGVVRTHQIVRPFQNLTVLENVMVGAIYGKARPLGARERALEVLDFCSLRDRAPQLPGGLTLAGRKRLELARALAPAPRGPRPPPAGSPTPTSGAAPASLPTPPANPTPASIPKKGPGGHQ